ARAASAPTRPAARTCAASPRTGSACRTRDSGPGASAPRGPARRRARRRDTAASSSRSRHIRTTSDDRLLCEVLLQRPPTAMQPRHHGSDRDVEDLRRLRIRELADVDEDDDVAKVVRHFGKRLDDRVLREPLDHAVLVGILVAERRLELVVEEVVAFLERLYVGRPLQAAAAVDVQIREDAEQPCAEVRARLVLLPRAERARVRLLHQVLCLLARADEPAGDAIDLIAELERFLFE